RHLNECTGIRVGGCDKHQIWNVKKRRVEGSVFVEPRIACLHGKKQAGRKDVGDAKEIALIQEGGASIVLGISAVGVGPEGLDGTLAASAKEHLSSLGGAIVYGP